MAGNQIYNLITNHQKINRNRAHIPLVNSTDWLKLYNRYCRKMYRNEQDNEITVQWSNVHKYTGPPICYIS